MLFHCWLNSCPTSHQWLVMHLLDTCTLSTLNQGSVDVLPLLVEWLPNVCDVGQPFNQQWTTAGWSQKSGYPCRPLHSPGENVNNLNRNAYRAWSGEWKARISTNKAGERRSARAECAPSFISAGRAFSLSPASVTEGATWKWKPNKEQRHDVHQAESTD